MRRRFNCPECGTEWHADVPLHAPRVRCPECRVFLRLDEDAELVDGMWRDLSTLTPEPPEPTP